MLTEVGNIVAVEQDGLWVETLKKSVCGQCKARHGCGQRLLANYNPEMSYIKALYNAESAQCDWQLGDSVVIGIDEKALLNATLLAYMVPLLALLVGLGLANWLIPNEAAMVIGATLGLVLGGAAVRIHSQRQMKNKHSCYLASVIGPAPQKNASVSQKIAVASI